MVKGAVVKAPTLKVYRLLSRMAVPSEWSSGLKNGVLVMVQDDVGKAIPGRELSRNRASYITKTPRGGVFGKKSDPKRLTKFLDRLLLFPRVKDACAWAGLSYSSLRCYLAKSESGKSGDGFDLTYREETKRFHLHYADCLDEAVQMVEDEYMTRAVKGYDKILHNKGRVIYRIDPELEGLGFTGSDAYLLDEDGKPIPESIHRQDPKVMLAVLRAWRRDRYGADDKRDVNVRGGVMVVGVRAKTSEEIEELEKQALSAPVDVEFREAEDDQSADQTTRDHSAAAPSAPPVEPPRSAPTTAPQNEPAPARQSIGDGRDRLGRGVVPKGGFKVA